MDVNSQTNLKYEQLNSEIWQLVDDTVWPFHRALGARKRQFHGCHPIGWTYPYCGRE